MRTRPSLRLRFTLASTALVFAISALSAVAVHTIREYLEDTLLEQLMQREVDEYAYQYRRNPNELPPRSTELRSYIVGPGDTDGLPVALHELAPGIWHDIMIEGRNYQVANFTLQDKRFYLTYDITSVERREYWLTVVLVSTVLLATALAAVLGWRLSRVVVAPVAQLAAGIKALEPGRAEPGLAQRFTDVDLGAIATAFDGYARRLAEFIERERAFTEDVSHELRTPISVVATAAERLGHDAALAEVLRPTVERLARAGRQMQQTTQALLYMARETEPPDEVMRPVPLRRVLEDLVADQRRALRDRPFDLTAALGVDGPAVPQGLATIVIGNLLSNAIQHSGAGGAELVHEDGEVSVRDRGAGIPPEALPHIFDRHYRGPRSGGLGLGLHIVKRVCDRQGWRLEARSTPGQETVLSVRFGPAGTAP
jgi:signal transduction histidine kinase